MALNGAEPVGSAPFGYSLGQGQPLLLGQMLEGEAMGGGGGEGLSVGHGGLGSFIKPTFLFQPKQRAALLASLFVWFLLYVCAGFGAFLAWI